MKPSLTIIVLLFTSFLSVTSVVLFNCTFEDNSICGGTIESDRRQEDVRWHLFQAKNDKSGPHTDNTYMRAEEGHFLRSFYNRTNSTTWKNGRQYYSSWSIDIPYPHDMERYTNIWMSFSFFVWKFESPTRLSTKTLSYQVSTMSTVSRNPVHRSGKVNQWITEKVELNETQSSVKFTSNHLSSYNYNGVALDDVIITADLLPSRAEVRNSGEVDGAVMNTDVEIALSSDLFTSQAIVPELDLLPEAFRAKNGIIYILIGSFFLVVGFPIVIMWLVCRYVRRKMRAIPAENYSTDLYLTPIDRSTGVFTSLSDTQLTCQAGVHGGFLRPPTPGLPETTIPDYCDAKVTQMYADTIDNPFTLLERPSKRKKPDLPPKKTEKTKKHQGLPPKLPLPEIPPEKNPEYSDGETESYYSTTDQTTTRGRVFQDKEICPILEIKTGKLYNRWMGTIDISTETSKCVFMTTVTDAGLRSKDVQWNAFVKRALELPKSNNLSEIKGIGVLKGKIHLIHEYLIYGTLEVRINSSENITASKESFIPMLPSEVMRHLLGVLEGMELIHSYGFLHPGLSTKKILLTNQGICKLYDFCLSEDAAKIIAIKKSEVAFSVNQLAPEVALRNEYSSASDVWSTAVVIWEMISYGVPPFPRISDAIHEMKVSPPSPSTLPEEYKHMSKSRLFQCWNQNESSRPTINQLRLCCIKVLKSQVDTYNIPEIYFGSTKTEQYVSMKGREDGENS